MEPSSLIAYDLQLMIYTEVEMPICQARLQDVSSECSRIISQGMRAAPCPHINVVSYSIEMRLKGQLESNCFLKRPCVLTLRQSKICSMLPSI